MYGRVPQLLPHTARKQAHLLLALTSTRSHQVHLFYTVPFAPATQPLRLAYRTFT